jgi:hypothetical protein
MARLPMFPEEVVAAYGAAEAAEAAVRAGDAGRK